MIYYSNSTLTLPHMVFIGRWSPFHKGHAAIINAKRQTHPKLPILVMVRNTQEDTFTPIVRAEYIKIWMQKNDIQGTIMIIPNVEGVYWGRGVGYNVGIVDVDASIQKISGTKIRSRIAQKSANWKRDVIEESESYILSPVVSHIIDHGLVIWLTGCPSSGKTTIANALLQKLHDLYPYLKTQLLDGDDMRESPLASFVGFTKKDRVDHIQRMAYLAKMFADHGILVVCAFVSPDRRIRKRAKQIIGTNRFVEVYVKASKKTRLKRDTKGMYKKALSGKLKNFTGLSAPYDAPIQPNVICNTGRLTVYQCVNRILAHIIRE